MIRFAAFLCIAVAMFLTVGTANAATYTVTKTADTNDGVCDADCSLREAVTAANASADNDEIVFDAAVFFTPQTITLSGTEIVILQNGSLKITGPGFQKLTISGNNLSRIITISRATAAISGIRFTGGNGVGAADSGRAGAIYNFGGTTVISDCVVTGNSATLGGGAFNNASSNSPTPAVPGNLTIVNCTVSNNTSASSGGAIQNFSTSLLTILNSTFTGNTSNGGVGGGAIAANGGMRVSNSTFVGNTATTDPGGAIQSNGTSLGLVLTNVTIVGNTATSGGGLHRGTTNTASAIRNSIIAGNTGGASPDVTNSTGGLVSMGNNIIGVTGTSTGWIASDMLDTNPVVGPLGDYGGIVRTVPLLQGSPAINAGQSCVTDLSCTGTNPPFPITTDARFFGRGTVDIGAYEVSEASTAVLPNAGLDQAYSHVIAPSSAGFTFATTGNVPTGLSISNAGGQAVLSGTPTVAGTYLFTITATSDTTPAESRSQLYMLTVSANPGNSFLLLKFSGELGEILNSPSNVTLTDLQGNVRTARLSPFGYAQFDNLPTGGAFVLQVNNKTYGSNSPRTYSILGSVVVELGVESRGQKFPGSERRR